ncbi:MAG: hypothetical protein ACYDBB_23360 [Armatimonadota bacterium]
MANAHACCSIIFNVPADELIARYEANAEPANGYLTRLDDSWVMVDAFASETADWGRQSLLAAEMTGEDGVAISILMTGQYWALGLAHAGKPGTMAVYLPGNEDVLDKLPFKLMEFEQGLVALFPDALDADELDRIFGAVIEMALPIDDAVDAILAMLGCAPDWLRWSWYDAIPHQLFMDPDFIGRVRPMGEAKDLWSE